jgi:RimJ/RimL family protein N-acetyltransferase
MQAALRPSSNVPVIETDRLRLRAHRPDDFAACRALWSDPIVNRYTTGKPLASEDVWAKMLRYGGLWAMLGYGYWVIEEKASGDFVGEVGFADFKRDVQPSLDGMPESGWVLMPRIHGKGYATEAVQAAIAWGDEHFGDRKTCCIIHVENAASIRLAEKCGYRQWQASVYKEHDVLLFTR